MSKSSGRPTTLTVATRAACLALAAMAASLPAAAQEEPPSGPAAEVRTGTCATPGDIVALLAPLPVDGVIASESPAAVVTSITEVPLPLTTLTAEPHVITLEDPGGGAGELCAAITGPSVDAPGLATAMATEEGAVAGIAWLRELGLEATTVHLFLVAEPMEPIAGPTAPGASPSPAADASPSPEPSPSPAPDGSPSPDDGGIPDGEIDPSEDIDVDVAD